MAEDARKAIGAMRRSHNEMVKWVEDLPPDELRAPSGASKWSVAQVLSHLGSTAEIGRNTLIAGEGDPDASPAIWDRWNSMSPAEQAANFVESEGRLVDAYEALSDDDLANKKVDVKFLPMPIDIAFLAGMRLSEVGLHRWDVAVAFDPHATVREYLVPFLLDRLPVFAGFFAQPIGKTGRVAIVTTDPVRSYVLEQRDDGATLQEAEADDAGTRLALPAEALLRLTAGRLAPEHTPATVQAVGDMSLDDLRRVFPGY
jgi:uncharacterized protein (TIGR03083 family)